MANNLLFPMFWWAFFLDQKDKKQQKFSLEKARMTKRKIWEIFQIDKKKREFEDIKWKNIKKIPLLNDFINRK